MLSENMETAIASLLSKLIEYGPGFLVAGLFMAMYWLERKKNERLAEKLYELGLQSLKSDLEHTKMYTALEKAIETLGKTISNLALELLKARNEKD
jgi:hypothetical protein